jgi:hypothetical protein
MENNIITDAQYEQKASGFFKKAIAGLICAAFPIACIVAIFLGAGNHKDIVNYVNAGGLHTPKIKTSAALSKGAMFAGIGMTIVYLVYFVYVILVVLAIIFAVSLPDQH